MLKRYTVLAIAAIWDEAQRFRNIARVEEAVVRARVQLGEICGVAVPDQLAENLSIDVDEINRLEVERFDHEIVAFLFHTSEQLPEDLKPYWHDRLTSNDVTDTAMCMQMRQSVEFLIGEFADFREALKQRAIQHKRSVQIGRTHDVHAEAITFGVKLARYYDESTRHLARLEQLHETVSVGKISGMVGMYSLSPEVEQEALGILGLRPIISTQIIPREIHAWYLATFAVIAGFLNKIADDMRSLQSTEIREVQVYFDPANRGSTNSPHKRNPWKWENEVSMARQMRGYVGVGLENQQTHHERDMSNSASEKITLPDATNLIAFMIQRATGLLKNLIVYKDRMRNNLELTKGLIYSGDVQAMLAEKSGLPREQAYGLVHKVAQHCWDKDLEFYAELLKDNEIMSLVSEADIRSCFNLGRKLQYVDHIFERVFGTTTI